MVCYRTLTTFDSQPSTSIFTEGWGNLDTTSNSVVAKSVFMMLQKKFYKPADWMSPLIRILAPKCIQYMHKKCILRHQHICVMCNKDNSVDFEFHATFPWLTIDYFESSNGFWHKCVNVSKKRIFRHLVIFVDQLWKFRFRNVFFIVEAPKE